MAIRTNYELNQIRQKSNSLGIENDKRSLKIKLRRTQEKNSQIKTKTPINIE